MSRPEEEGRRVMSAFDSLFFDTLIYHFFDFIAGRPKAVDLVKLTKHYSVGRDLLQL